MCVCVAGSPVPSRASKDTSPSSLVDNDDAKIDGSNGNKNRDEINSNSSSGAGERGGEPSAHKRRKGTTKTRRRQQQQSRRVAPLR